MMNHLKEAMLKRETGGEVQTGSQSQIYTVEELECKICYNLYNSHSRKPKVLDCLHRICAGCLKKIVDTGETTSSVISCPFCRYETQIPDDEVRRMKDDQHLLTLVSCQDQARPAVCGEVVLRSSSLNEVGGMESIHVSSDCLVITILDLCERSSSSESVGMLNLVSVYHPPRLDSLPTQKCCRWTSHTLPHCLLGALCLVYFSSLPLGIYLLMIGHLWVGVILVSLVPTTLLMLVVYGFCQCLCQELMEILTVSQHIP